MTQASKQAAARAARTDCQAARGAPTCCLAALPWPSPVLCCPPTPFPHVAELQSLAVERSTIGYMKQFPAKCDACTLAGRQLRPGS
jgi:hypothetical protein